MHCVVQVAESLLSHDRYYDDSDDKDICDDLIESDLDSEDCLDHFDSSQDLAEDMKSMSIVQTQVPDQNLKSKLVELTEQLDKLTVQLAQYEKPSPVPLVIMNQSLKCFMCNEYGHGIQDCTQMKEFIALGVLKVDMNNRVVLDDGSSLPYAGTGGISPLVQEIANQHMASHMELKHELEPTSCKFNNLGNIDFESCYIE